MEIYKIIKKYLISSIVTLLTFFLMAFFITEFFYNTYNAKYIYVFDSDSENIEEVITVEYFDSVINEINEYNKTAEKKISYANIEYADMLKESELRKNEHYELVIKQKYFPSTVKSNGLVNVSENRVVKYLDLIFSYSDKGISFVELKTENYVNPFLVGGITSGIALVFIIGFIIFLYILKGVFITTIEDNEEIYSSIFHKGYWKKSTQFMKKVKDLCMISILFSMMLVCKLIPIPSGFGSLGLGFTYLFFSVISLIYGPICGVFIGFCSDVLGFFLFQGGSIFFFGYTLSAMLTGFIYGIFFFKKKITFTNCLLARFFVNIVVNVGLGTVWWGIVYNLKGEALMTYTMLTALPKNIIYLLPQSILLFIVFKMIEKTLARFGLIDDKIANNVELF